MTKKLLKPSTGAPSGLLKDAQDRSQEFVAKLDRAMAKIELEIEQNEGLYPYNGGTLNQAEVCRRAGVKNRSLGGKSHKDTTRARVNDWVAAVCARIATGRKIARRAVTDRINGWKDAHASIANAYQLVELELVELQAKVRSLESENGALRALLSAEGRQKVTALPTRDTSPRSTDQ